MTNASGNYSITVPVGGSYTVTPSKGPLTPGTGSINSVDVLAIQRHYLAISLIPAGCRLTAADASVNGTVNNQDVIAVQRFFLGLTTGIASTGQYKFSPTNRTYSIIGSNQTGQDYAMYIVGDVAAAFGNRPPETTVSFPSANRVPLFSVLGPKPQRFPSTHFLTVPDTAQPALSRSEL